MKFSDELRYTKSHEWVRREGGNVVVGITDYAQKEISDVVFVDLPKPDQRTQQGKAAAVVESVKAAFDIYAPVSGKVVKANQSLEAEPGRVNQDPYGEGWLFEIVMSNESEWDSLLSANDYENVVKEGVK